jgi:C-terminal processing protease CtpA/Prc/Tol biopolymer transport system component
VNLYAFEPHFVTDPSLSPDGSEVCFVYDGDLWKVPFTGGKAIRLTSTASLEHGPCWSPDGSKIAFSANRDGQTYVYLIPASGGEAFPVSKESLTVCDWFPDGKALLCSKANLTWGTSLYKLKLDGTRPVIVTEIGDYFSALNAQGNKIVFNRYGDAYRERYRGSSNGDLWEYDLLTSTYNRLTDTDYTERYPRYSQQQDALYFCASDGARYQLFRVKNNNFLQREKLTSFDTWSVRDISIARTNDRIAFELFDTIWTYNPELPTDDQIAKLDIEINEDNWKNIIREEIVSDYFDDFAVSGDELLIAFSYKYDLFVMPRKGGEVRQITFDQSGASNPVFLSDNRTIVFTKQVNGIPSLYKVRVDSVFQVTGVDWYGQDHFYVDRIYPSSDFHWVIEYTDSLGSGRIAVADSSFTDIKPVLTDKVIATTFCSSPDGSMAVFATLRNDIYTREVFIYDFLSGSRKKIMSEDSWLYGLTWSADQKSIIYSKREDNYKICRLDLIPRDEYELETDSWKEILSKQEVKSTHPAINLASDKSVDVMPLNKVVPKLKYEQIDWYQLEKRVSTILEVSDFIYSVQAIDDTSFYYIQEKRDKDSKSYLYKINVFGKHPSEIGSFPIGLQYQFINDKSIYYKEGVRLKSFSLKSKSRTEIANNFSYIYDQQLLNQKVFEQVWGLFGKNFYDPEMHENDWYLLYNRFKPFLQYAYNINVLEVIIEEMIGEINSSHTGFYPRADNRIPLKPAASLGMELDYRHVTTEGIRISRVYPGSALYQYFGVRDNAILLAIDNITLTPQVAIDSLLAGKVGKKLELTIRNINGKEIKAIIRGLNWSQNRELWFRDKVDRLRQKTNDLSSNRIGYVLIPRMSGSEYNNFISEVFTQNADKEALIIDIRGNVGGRIHNELLNFLSLQPNAYTTSRRFGAEKTLTPGRTWTKPVVLLIDEHSFSDAEIFPQLFKEKGLGKVIGMPTSGSVIGTWEVTLMDGSSMRMPGSGWYRLDGTNMEGNGAQPDIRVEMDLNDLVADNDLQLAKAVEVLLEQLK